MFRPFILYHLNRDLGTLHDGFLLYKHAQIWQNGENTHSENQFYSAVDQKNCFTGRWS